MMFKKYFDPIFLIILDTVLLFVSLSYFFAHSGYLILEHFTDSPGTYMLDIFVSMNILYWLVIYLIKGVYLAKANSSRLDILLKLFRVQILGTFLLVVLPIIKLITRKLFSSSPTVMDISSLHVIFAYFFIIYIITSSFHFIYFSLRKYLIKFGIGKKRVLIIGFGEDAKNVISIILSDKESVFSIVGIVSENSNDFGLEYKGVKVLSELNNIKGILKEFKINDIIIGFPIESDEFYKLRMELSGTDISFFISADIKDMMKGYVKTHQLVGVPLIELLPEHMPYWEVKAKRLLDIVFSFGVLTIGFPFLLLIGLFVKFTSKGPMIYSQERLGFHGKPYKVHKYRTMYTDAEKHSGPVWAGKDDPRITPFGKILRKTRLDELPQFINIFFGEMSIVGPRPEREFFVNQLKKEVKYYERRLLMKPGLTGWAQINLEYDVDFSSVGEKVLYDLYYLENMSIILDLKIIFKTISVVIFGKGAH